MFDSLNKLRLLTRLDAELQSRNAPRILFVCGGAALVIMNVVNRQTRDIDVLSPEIDSELEDAARAVGRDFGLNPGWLNNGPASLQRELDKGWEGRTISIFKGNHLELRALGRSDFLATKLFAFCDREDDFEDVLGMRPTLDELGRLKPWVLLRDSSKEWPPRVERCFVRIKEALKYE